MSRRATALGSGALALTMLVSGCPVYVPAVEQVASPCEQASDCMTGWRCVDGICVTGATGLVDASSRDVQSGDARRDGAAGDGAGSDRVGSDGALLDGSASDRAPFDHSGRDLTGLDRAPSDRIGSDQVARDGAGRDQLSTDLWQQDRAVADQWQPDLAQPDAWIDLPPPPLAGLSATTSHERGAIDVTIDFPDDVSDYARVYILRLPGVTPPAATCLEGILAASFTIGHFVDGSFTDRGLPELEPYSYRACAYDALGQVTGGPFATAVTKGCWYASGTESHADLPAKIVDAWANQWRPSGTSTPRQIFAGRTFASGDRIALTSFSGRSISRIYNNRVEGAVDCPQQWKLHFQDSGGAILWPTSAAEDLAAYSSGIDVPASAATAWIGFREGGCDTGSDCATWAGNSPYFDNCDNRTVYGDCEKCNYEFTYGVFTCNAP